MANINVTVIAQGLTEEMYALANRIREDLRYQLTQDLDGLVIARIGELLTLPMPTAYDWLVAKGAAYKGISEEDFKAQLKVKFNDPIDLDGKGWGFWDETWGNFHGGYATRAEAEGALREYVAAL